MGIINMFSGGAMERLTIFALGIMRILPLRSYAAFDRCHPVF
jgi:hypothetical protein